MLYEVWLYINLAQQSKRSKTEFLREVSPNMKTDPKLTELTGEKFIHKVVNIEY